MKSCIKLLIICLLLFGVAYSYLELKIARIELKSALKNQETKCINKSDDEDITKKEKEEKKKKKKKSNDDDDDESEEIDDEDIEESQNYKQICYEKDISYVWPTYLNKNLYLLSMDTTIPIGWIKGPKCHIQGSSKKCSMLSTNIKEEIKGKIYSQKKNTNRHSKSDYAIIEGSSELVKGIIQNTSNVSFISRDTSRFANLFELLAMGFYLAQENQTLSLEHTNMINSTEISPNLNYLADGGISLRFDQNSEKSFLKELFNYQNNLGKIATVWIKDKRGQITIGDVSTRHALNGYGGIQWVKVEQDDDYGKVPTISDVIIDSPSEQNFISIHDQSYPAIISLSASYIGLPQNLMARWQKKLSSKGGCEVNNVTKYLECKKIKEEDETKVLTFVIDDKKISFSFKDLILGREHSKTLLNLKVTMHDTYAIIGEPLFQKYLVLFDYQNNKVGFSLKNDQTKEAFRAITLVRFICFVFLFGCCFIVGYAPIKKGIEILKARGRFKAENPNETKRLRGYGPIQQNQYDELSGQIDDALKDDDN